MAMEEAPFLQVGYVRLKCYNKREKQGEQQDEEQEQEEEGDEEEEEEEEER